MLTRQSRTTSIILHVVSCLHFSYVVSTYVQIYFAIFNSAVDFNVQQSLTCRSVPEQMNTFRTLLASLRVVTVKNITPKLPLCFYRPGTVALSVLKVRFSLSHSLFPLFSFFNPSSNHRKFEYSLLNVAVGLNQGSVTVNIERSTT